MTEELLHLTHLHPSQDEKFEVRSGRLTAVVDGEERKLRSGDTLRIAPGTPHKMWNADNQTATALWRTRPAGRTADWFATIDRLSNGGTRKPPVPTMAKAVTTHAGCVPARGGSRCAEAAGRAGTPRGGAGRPLSRVSDWRLVAGRGR